MAGGVGELGGAEPDLQALLERGRSHLRIAVVHGGDSAQTGAVLARARNPRPWKSYSRVAESIAETLNAAGFSVPLVCADDLHLIERLRRADINFVWLNTAGMQGRAAMLHAAALMEMTGLGYLGHDPLNAGLLDHKHALKHVLRSLGIATSPFILWHPDLAEDPCDTGVLARHLGEPPLPVVAKPTCGRASHNVFVCDTVAELREALGAIRAADSELAVIEPFLSGREYCVTVAGPTRVRGCVPESCDAPLILSPLQRRLEADERIFSSMDRRPIGTDRFRLLRDDDRDGDMLDQLSGLGRRMYAEVPLNSVVRVDVRCGGDGVPRVLEANPKPDLAPPRTDGQTSLVCAGLAQAGMSYQDLLLSLLLDRLRAIAAGHTSVSAATAQTLTGTPGTAGRGSTGNAG